MAIFSKGIMGSRSDLSMFTDQQILDYVNEHGLLGQYKAIQDLNPDLFVQFKYPVYAGQQVLFRDELCTSPVTDAGNHTIGGVKDPFTGEIVLTQASASRRPLWGGESVGAIFDGIDDYLSKGSAALSGTSYSVFASVVSVGTGSTYGSLVDGVADSAFYLAQHTTNNRSYVQMFDDSSAIIGALAIPTYPGVVGGKKLGWTVANVNTDGVQTDATSGGGVVTPGGNNLTIGARVGLGANAFLPGTISWVAGFNRDTTPAEELILRGNL